jgi:radical SAM superfamily enzyme YgiQ (UPF0313 family)
VNVVLISTYELGRQPFGLASPAAWLREAGATVTCIDVSRQPLAEDAVRDADMVAFYVPMHTATRLAVAMLPSVRGLNPRARVCFYGLYAPVNEEYLRRLGADFIIGGEFEEPLAALITSLDARCASPRFSGGPSFSSDISEIQSDGTSTPEVAFPTISLARQKFRVPDRTGLPPLEKYARLLMPGGKLRVTGYTEASRGCKHLCRHCPIVPVYNGVFRIVDREVVLEDVRRQAAAGAEHITFGDPDFFNGIGHAIPLVEALHREFPRLTYDVTIKIEHLLKHQDCLPKLRDTGCLFVTSAVESVDDVVLEKLAKNHTRADFLRVVALFRETGLTLAPTFVVFTPWTTLESYCDLLETIRDQDLIENVAPIQFAIRLLIPAGSRLLELPDIQQIVEPFDQEKLVYPWQHADPRVDALCERLQAIVHSGEKMKLSRMQIFENVQQAAYEALGRECVTADVARCLEQKQIPHPHSRERRGTGFGMTDSRFARNPVFASRATIPYLNEPWYC